MTITCLADIQATTYDGCSQGLTSIPTSNIPTDTTVLKLCHNQITFLPALAFPFPRLNSLDLCENLISHVDGQAFYNLTWVTFIDMSHNKISALSPEVFTTVGSHLYDYGYEKQIDLS